MDSNQNIIDECLGLYKEGRIEQVVELLTDCINSTEKPDYKALLLSGKAHQMLGKYDESIQIFEKALSKKYPAHQALFCIAESLMKKNKISKCVEIIKLGCHLGDHLADKDFVDEAATDLICSLYDFGYRTEAVKLFEYLMSEVSNADCLIKSYLHCLTGSLDNDVRDGEKALSLAGQMCKKESWSNWQYITYVAAAYAELGRFDEAVEYAELALEKAPADKKDGRISRLKQYRGKTPFRFTRLLNI